MTFRGVRAVRVAVLGAALVAAIAVPVATQSASASDAPSVKVSASRVFPDASEAKLRRLSVRVVSPTLPVTVQLMRSGAVVQEKTVSTSGASVGFTTSTLRSGNYVVVASDGHDATKARVTVARGWAPIDSSRPSWKICGVVTWSYDASKAPSGGDVGLRKDARAAFALLASATGLTFKPVLTGAKLVVQWDPSIGADGLGGLSWTGGPGSVVSGYIKLNSTSEWAKTPGTDERGILLLHEAAHALGLGHVGIDTALMSPTYRPGLSNTTLGAGEKLGFTSLYHPRQCS